MADELAGKTIAFLVANEGVEQVELTTPWEHVRHAGGVAVLAAPSGDPVQAFNHFDKSDRFSVDVTTNSLAVDDYDGIVLPGGVANPDQLRTDPAAVRFVKSFFDAGKPAAVICHGPWTLVEAGVVAGRTVTSYPSIRTDLRNAGGNVVDEEVAVDGNLITSRSPADLPAFCASLIAQLEHAPARN
jgi:protease I